MNKKWPQFQHHPVVDVREKNGEDATMDAAQLWDLNSENCHPRVQPEFPDMENSKPDAFASC
jgi:hypothetical protein